MVLGHFMTVICSQGNVFYVSHKNYLYIKVRIFSK